MVSLLRSSLVYDLQEASRCVDTVARTRHSLRVWHSNLLVSDCGRLFVSYIPTQPLPNLNFLWVTFESKDRDVNLFSNVRSANAAPFPKILLACFKLESKSQHFLLYLWFRDSGRNITIEDFDKLH